MPDMLVKLYDLPDFKDEPAHDDQDCVAIRRAIAPEKHIVADWVRERFNPSWASECEIAFANHPVSCFIAVENGRIIGFACYEATCRDFFGPTGVDPESRGKGIGKMLLLRCLHAMKAEGYGYAVIGGAGPVDFYAKTVGATVIEGSCPGIYRGMLKSGK